MIEIPLHSKTHPGLVALIDDEDAELVGGYSWHPFATSTSKTTYAIANVPGSRGKAVMMHRLIAGAPRGRKVDHENRNGLDNRRENLRFGTNSQHAANRGFQSNNRSGYKGVFWNTQKRKWTARIAVDGKQKYLGSYEDPAEAARAYDRAAREHYGEFAGELNFPPAGGDVA